MYKSGDPFILENTENTDAYPHWHGKTFSVYRINPFKDKIKEDHVSFLAPSEIMENDEYYVVNTSTKSLKEDLCK